MKIVGIVLRINCTHTLPATHLSLHKQLKRVYVFLRGIRMTNHLNGGIIILNLNELLKSTAQFKKKILTFFLLFASELSNFFSQFT